MSEYWELLRDPRWQRRRLEVLQSANFTCAHCRDTTSELQVHHTHYKKGCKPWEYDGLDLVCLCKPCHEKVTQGLSIIRALVGYLTHEQLCQVSGYAGALLMREAGFTFVPPKSHSTARGIADALGVSAENVSRASEICKGRLKFKDLAPYVVGAAPVTDF